MNDLVESWSLPAVYGQLLGVGVLWIWLHCSGMCGPLIVGLDVGGLRHPSSSRGAGALASVARVLAYQLGRAITYSTLGALAGVVGAGFRSSFELGGGVVAVVVGATVVLTALRPKRTPRAEGLVSLGARSPQGMLDRALDVVRLRLVPLAAGPGLQSRLLLGAVLGLLPCMITAWALGLAAVSASPIHGAAIMVLLVALTTPLLVVAAIAPRWLPKPPRWVAAGLPRLLLAASGVVVVLAGLAGLDVIGHAHAGFTALGRHWLIMFW